MPSMLEVATDRVERMLAVIPEDHELATALQSRLSSLNFSSPENANVHVNRICEDLSTHIGDPEKIELEWQLQVFQIWMEKA